MSQDGRSSETFVLEVNITPCAGFVEPLGALGVGAIGALCCVFAARGLKKLNLVDDSLDCFSLHGVGGFAGAVLGGFFDLEDGLIYGGDGLLLAKNLAGAAFGVVYSAAVTAVIFGLMRIVMRMRVSEEQELEGRCLWCNLTVVHSGMLWHAGACYCLLCDSHVCSLRPC